MSTIEIIQSKKRTITEGLQPLPPGKALLHFAIIGIGFRLSIYVLQPFLLEKGLSPFEAFAVCFIVPSAILFALAFGTAKGEGVPEQARAMATRFRLRRFSWRDLLWLLAAFLIAVIGSFILGPTREWMLDAWPALNPPATFPVILDPRLQDMQLVPALKNWLGPEIIGDMGMILLLFALFFFNIFGEELYWRGILLPRQELVHGRWTWVIHGVMWNLFHLFIYPWYLVFGLPIALAISYVAQKTGNTWISILLHTLANFYMYALMAGAIAGAV